MDPVTELDLVVAIDAGNSKIDTLLVDAGARVLARARGGRFRPQTDGVDPAMDELSDVMGKLLAGVELPVRLVSAYLAGADSPEEEAVLQDELHRRAWGRQVQVGNDTLALLRCGAPDGWGVAVVCGAGVNAVAVAPDKRIGRFPALGHHTGDWGGGWSLGQDALWLAVRGEDGRGAPTALSSAIAMYFALPTATDVGLAVSRGELAGHRLTELTPLLFGTASAGDGAAAGLVARMADEVVAMASALIGRLGLLGLDVPVVLGGGVLSSGYPPLLRAIETGLAARVPRAHCVLAEVAPVVGAALLGLDALGVPAQVSAGLLARERR